MKYALALAFAVPLAACATVPTSPAAVADATVLDEKAAIGVELTYTAAAKAATLAISTGAVSNRTTIAKIGELDRKAYAAVKAVRAAYDAGNASSYASAFATAQSALSELLAAF